MANIDANSGQTIEEWREETNSGFEQFFDNLWSSAKHTFESFVNGTRTVRNINKMRNFVNYGNPYYSSESDRTFYENHPLLDEFNTRVNEALDDMFKGEPLSVIAEDLSPALADPAPVNNTSAHQEIYSDWSPTARLFGMDRETAYAEHMANTAHQREVADLRAAGLNPVLGISGSGASGVSGSVATGASSAQKGINSDALVDVIGATASLLTVALTKKPYLAAAVGQAAQAGGNLLFGD